MLSIHAPAQQTEPLDNPHSAMPEFYLLTFTHPEGVQKQTQHKYIIFMEEGVSLAVWFDYSGEPMKT